MFFHKKLNLTHMVENISLSFDLMAFSEPPRYHSIKVAFIGTLIGYGLNLTRTQRIDLYLSSLLHDVGAIASEAQMLLEYTQRKNIDLQHHATVGFEILKEIPFFETIADIVKDHHNASSDNLLSRIIYFSDEIEVILRSSDIFEPRVLQAKVLSIFKDKAEFKDILDVFMDIIKTDAFLIIYSNIEEIKKYLQSHVEDRFVVVNPDALNSFAKAVAKNFVDIKSKFTLNHSLDVAHTALVIAMQLGLSKAECKTIETAGFLHDIGKLFVSNEILEYPGKLEGKNWLKMKSHAYFTYSFLKQLELCEDIIHIASSHHECLDGSGYPFGLNESKLTTGAQIMAVADIYAALRQLRPYKPHPLDHNGAVEILLDMAKKGKINKEFVKAIPVNIRMWRY